MGWWTRIVPVGETGMRVMEVSEVRLKLTIGPTV